MKTIQVVLDEPRMFNHNRGLWGYTGRAADGELLTVQATGMGGPSAAIVAEVTDWDAFTRDWVSSHGLAGTLAMLLRGPSPDGARTNHAMQLIPLAP